MAGCRYKLKKPGSVKVSCNSSHCWRFGYFYSKGMGRAY